MKMTTLLATVTSLGGLLLLGACVTANGPSKVSDFSTACMFEVSPPGSYEWSDGDTEVTPGDGGTAAGAAAMNDCIRRKMTAEGAGVAMAERTTVKTEGDTTVKTYSYGQPPADMPASRKSTATKPEACRSRNILTGGSGYYGCTE